MMAPQRLGPRADLALLALRLAVGAAFVLHGLPKIGHATTWATRALPGTPAWLQVVAAVAEFGGGIALILGAATPLFAFLIACDMVVVIFFVQIPHGAVFVSTTGGAAFELPLVYLASAFALLAAGARYVFSRRRALSPKNAAAPPLSAALRSWHICLKIEW